MLQCYGTFLTLLAMDRSVRQTALFRTYSSPRCSVRLRPLLLASLWLSCGSVGGLRGPQLRARRSLSMTILDSPSAQRNKEPIWGILSEKVLSLLSEDRSLTVVEVAAGCGVHTEYFATQLSRPGRPFQWYPTDPDATSRDSIQGRIKESNINGVQSPLSLTLDVNGIVESETDAVLGKELDLIICINMIHISPWDATRGLMKVAGSKLRKGGILYCYGPYRVGGTAVESNLNFDRSLRMRDPDWGVRDLEKVVEEASACGLTMLEKVEMPANNLSVVYAKK